MKKIFSGAMAAFFAGTVFVLLVSCASTGGAGGEDAGVAGAWAWGSFTDAANGGTSKIKMIEAVEQIDGEPLMIYSIDGEITSQYQYGYVGWYAFPDDPTLELLKTAKAFTFKVEGDGNAYDVMFCTADISDAAYYRTTFTPRKDQVTTITVKVGQLAQPADWGVKKPFNQDMATQIQFQTTNNGKPGIFKVKIYDLRIIQ
ncbi:MAG: CIA30 family protein [Treponema sp.]|jgi:hypothetical protein|nr:CIA30 family protein [Treponema sp.]